jgi:hypothetical protein
MTGMSSAAIAAKAPLIVTFNLADFPAKILSAHHIRAVHPDEFALSLYEAAPAQFVELVKLHRQALVNPPKTVAEYLSTLAQCGLNKTVARLQGHPDKI